MAMVIKRERIANLEEKLPSDMRIKKALVRRQKADN